MQHRLHRCVSRTPQARQQLRVRFCTRACPLEQFGCPPVVRPAARRPRLSLWCHHNQLSAAARPLLALPPPLPQVAGLLEGPPKTQPSTGAPSPIRDVPLPPIRLGYRAGLRQTVVLPEASFRGSAHPPPSYGTCVPTAQHPTAQ